MLCAAVPQASLSLGPVRSRGGGGASEGPLGPVGGAPLVRQYPHLAAIFQLSDCLVVCLAVCFSVLQCPGTCSQPYLNQLAILASYTSRDSLSRLWRRLADCKHSPDCPRPAACLLLNLSGRPQPPDLRRKTAPRPPTPRLASPRLALPCPSSPRRPPWTQMAPVRRAPRTLATPRSTMRSAPYSRRSHCPRSTSPSTRWRMAAK